MSATVNAARSVAAKALKRSPSVQQLRDEIRKQFKENLRSSRSRELWRRRDLFKNVVSGVRKHFATIDKSQLQGSDESITPDEIIHILKEAEQDFRQSQSEKEADQYLLNLDNQTNAVLDQFTFCSICSELVELEVPVASVICSRCADLHFKDEQF